MHVNLIFDQVQNCISLLETMTDKVSMNVVQVHYCIS